MSGYSKAFFVGGAGGFQGSDGLNPIHFHILVGDADRQWLEAHYFDASITPLGKIKTLIPEQPNYLPALVDACIAFFPQHFQACPTLPVVEKELQNTVRLDFDRNRKSIPAHWHELREEAMPWFRDLRICAATLRVIDLSALSNR